MVKKSESQRVDAQRNLKTLLETAMAVFASSGVNAPVREIAERAGVGIGTVYRHFPTRADLIVAVFRNELDACADAASDLAAKHEPEEALRAWVDRYVGFVGAKHGLAEALHSGDPAYAALPSYYDKKLLPAFAALLDAAVSSGSIRPGTDPDDLLRAISRLSTSAQDPDPERARRLIGLFLDGLRYGARGRKSDLR